MLIIKNSNNIEEYRVKAFSGVSDGKETTAVWETWVQFLDGDNPLEAILPGESSWTEEPGEL